MSEESSIEELIRKAKEAGLKTETREYDYSDDVGEIHSIAISSGKETRKLSFQTDERAHEILTSKLFDLSFIEDYEALVDLENGVIEGSSRREKLWGCHSLDVGWG
jgi:hypothetical protein